MDAPEKRNAPGLATRGVSVPNFAQVKERSQFTSDQLTGEPQNQALSLADRPCYCGPGRKPSSGFTCVNCGRFARTWKRIAERAPYLHTERRAV